MGSLSWWLFTQQAVRSTYILITVFGILHKNRSRVGHHKKKTRCSCFHIQLIPCITLKDISWFTIQTLSVYKKWMCFVYIRRSSAIIWRSWILCRREYEHIIYNKRCASFTRTAVMVLLAYLQCTKSITNQRL